MADVNDEVIFDLIMVDKVIVDPIVDVALVGLNMAVRTG